MRILCFDYGHKKIGVASGQTITGTAEALETVHAQAGNINWPRLMELIKKWHPDHLLVGKPLSMDGEENETSRAAREFGAALSEKSGLEVKFWDERLSTVEAKSIYKQHRKEGLLRTRGKEKMDAVAARLILESYLQSLG